MARNKAVKATPQYKSTKLSSTGGSALVSDHSVARDGRKQIEGISTARHHTVKPSSSSGTIGKGQPLKTASGVREHQTSDKPLGKVYRRSSPKN